jgi:hypothetical protein
MIVETYGQARRRPGTKFLAVSDSNYVTGVPPVGPPGGHWVVDRSVDSMGTTLTDVKRRCLQFSTTFEIDFVSRAGTGCLIGYDEFTDPPTIVASSPPRKYLEKPFQTPSQLQLKLGVGGCFCNSQIFAGDYTGTNSIDRLTGAETVAAVFIEQTGGSDCVLHPHSTTTIYELGDGYYGSVNHQACVTVESKTRKRLIAGPPCNPGCQLISGAYYQPTGTATEELQNEDTFANALERAGAPTGTAADSLLATQISDFCYTGHSSVWTTVFTDLKIGCSYTFVVTYTRGMDVITETTTFIAGSTSETLGGTIPTVLGTTTSAASGTLYVT